MAKAQVKVPLDIPDVRVLKTEMNQDGELIITIESTKERVAYDVVLGVLETIRTVCCDMYEGYTEAVREELPQAQIVIDRFHVTRHYHKAADQLRQSELKRLKKELPAEAYQELKGNMWAFREQPDDLTPQERRVLRKLFQHAPQVKQAYDLRQ